MVLLISSSTVAYPVNDSILAVWWLSGPLWRCSKLCSDMMVWLEFKGHQSYGIQWLQGKLA
jgi:hypothetical protein